MTQKKNNMALSAYMTELQSFNVIDKDHRNDKDEETMEMLKNKKKDKNEKHKDGPMITDINMI